MYRRLRKLEETALICRSPGLKNGLAAYYLGKAGATHINVDEPAWYTNRNSYEHELAITDFRMALEAIGLCQDFISERQVRKNFVWSRSSKISDQVIPDGILIEDVNGKPTAIALEIELNVKSLRRYKSVLEEYRFMRTVSIVWYVVRDDSTKNVVLKTWKDVQKFDFSPRIIISDFDEIITAPSSATVHIDDGTTSRPADFFKINKGGGGLLTTSEEVAQCVSSLGEENATSPE